MFQKVHTCFIILSCVSAFFIQFFCASTLDCFGNYLKFSNFNCEDHSLSFYHEFWKIFNLFFQIVFFWFSKKISGKRTNIFKNFYRLEKVWKNTKILGYWWKNRIKIHKLRKKNSCDIRILLEIFFCFHAVFFQNLW